MVGGKLNLKLLRDLRFSPLMFLGIVFMAAAGVALFGASYSLYLNLSASYELSYQKLNLADFTVPLQSAPEGAVWTLRRLPGVAAVEGRTVKEVEIDQARAQSRKITGRIISLPARGRPAINQLKLVSGGYPRRDRSRELLLEASYAKFYGYRPGDYVRVVVLDDRIRFRVAGIVQSPEYIYVIQSRESPMVSPRTFGVMWAREGVVDELFGTAGSCNEIGFRMRPGANRQTAMNLARRMLRPYGSDDPIPQEQQASVEFLRLDLIGLQALSMFFPVLFLTISSLSIYNLMSRMVHAQRNQIGFLRAIGFSRAAVGLHYVQFSVLIGFVGGSIGAFGGYYLGGLITRFYTGFLQVPYYDVMSRWGLVGAGILMTLIVTVLAGIMPARAAARLAPAQAIAVETPMAGRIPVIERRLPFLLRLPLLARLPLRNFMRSRRRTASTIAGIASAATLLLVSAGLLDSTDATIDFYFKHSMHYDAMVTYLHPTPEAALQQMRRWRGVRLVEPVLAAPVKLVKGDASKTTVLYGVAPTGRLFTITDARGGTIRLPRTGVVIAESTARKLGLRQGRVVRLTLPRRTASEAAEAQTEVPQGIAAVRQWLMRQRFRAGVLSSSRALIETRLDRIVRVSGVSYQPIGGAVFASVGEVRRWYGRALELPPSAVNAAALKIEPRYVDDVQRRLYDLRGVASVEVVRDMMEEIDQMRKSSNVFFLIMLSFSISLSAIIVFNSTLMNLIERTREIATLRTLGVGLRAIAAITTAENLMTYLVGIIVGLPFGTWAAYRFVQLYESESFNMRAVIFSRTYLLTVLGILAAVLIAQLPGIMLVRKTDLTRATKDIG